MLSLYFISLIFAAAHYDDAAFVAAAFAMLITTPTLLDT